MHCTPSELRSHSWYHSGQRETRCHRRSSLQMLHSHCSYAKDHLGVDIDRGRVLGHLDNNGDGTSHYRKYIDRHLELRSGATAPCRRAGWPCERRLLLGYWSGAINRLYRASTVHAAGFHVDFSIGWPSATRPTSFNSYF